MAGNPILGLFSQLAQIPKLTEERKERRQDRALDVEKKQSDIAATQSQNELRQFQGQALKMSTGQEWLKQQQQQLANDPKLASDPATLSALTTQAKQYGVALPMKTVNGQQAVDVDALVPSVKLQDLDFKARQYAMSLPSKAPDGSNPRLKFIQSLGVKDVDASNPFVQGDPYSPLSESEKTRLINLPAQLSDALGKGEITPRSYVDQIRANYAGLLEAGIKPDVLLDPELLKHTAGQMAETKINQLRDLGIHYQNEDAAKLASERRMLMEFQGKQQLGYARLSIEQSRIGIDSQNLGLRGAELGMAERRLDLASKAQNLASSRASQALFNDAFKRMQTTYDKAQTEYDGLIKNINSVTGNNSSFAPDATTTKRLTELRKQMDELKPKIEAASKMTIQAPANNASLITGNATKVTPSSSSSSNDKPPTQTHNGKTYYLYSDGNYYSKKP